MPAGWDYVRPGWPVKKDSRWISELAYQSLFELTDGTEASKIHALIRVAGEFDRPEIILNLTMDNLNERWVREKSWYRTRARYMYFDKGKRAYAVDEEAFRRKEPIAPERQIPPHCLE